MSRPVGCRMSEGCLLCGGEINPTKVFCQQLFLALTKWNPDALPFMKIPNSDVVLKFLRHFAMTSQSNR